MAEIAAVQIKKSRVLLNGHSSHHIEQSAFADASCTENVPNIFIAQRLACQKAEIPLHFAITADKKVIFFLLDAA
ncbi:hypothetical protein LJK87_38445 [Paenibacillus sp. P25]|nr:hypothetical protein LJK87_38445 [Paenibacillus sp. P25]